MDRSAVQEIVERRLDPLLLKLGLSDWEIKLSFEPSAADEDGSLTRAECTRLVDYRSASIAFNPEAFDDEDQVAKTLRHELFHCVLAPFDLYSTSVEACTPGDEARAVLGRVWSHAAEAAVMGLERMWEGLTAPQSPERQS